jgi:hypothetical protein
MGVTHGPMRFDESASLNSGCGRERTASGAVERIELNYAR